MKIRRRWKNTWRRTPWGHIKGSDTEIATLHNGKVTQQRFKKFEEPFSTTHGWYSNSWVFDRDNLEDTTKGERRKDNS